MSNNEVWYIIGSVCASWIGVGDLVWSLFEYKLSSTLKKVTSCRKLCLNLEISVFRHIMKDMEEYGKYFFENPEFENILE